MNSANTGKLIDSEQYGTLWEMTSLAQVVTFIGAGGKSSCLNNLSAEIYRSGKRVVATTTTKVFPMEFNDIWQSLEACPPEDIGYPCFWFAESDFSSGKWVGPQIQIVDAAINIEKEKYNTNKCRDHRYWVIEGDGARGKKIKCWAAHEPQVPLNTECGVLIVHGGLLGTVLKDKDIHRRELCSSLAGTEFNAKKAWDYFLNSPVFYPSYKHMSWVILFSEFQTGKNSPVPLDELAQEGERLLSQVKDSLNKPIHLRLGAGNPKGGKFRWYDLW